MAYGYIQTLSNKVQRDHINFYNRYSYKLAGDLYYAKDIDSRKQYPALIVGAPYGGTKEQGPCVWANELVQRGFVVLTFDQVNMGESSGEPRHVSSPDLFAESFSAAVDYLGVQVPFVDREKIGVIGICGSGGFSLAAAAADTRIKAIATASMYDMTDVRGMNNFSKEQLDEFKDKLTRQRWEDYANEMPEMDPITKEWFRFYAVPRGFHQNARGGGGFTTTSDLSMLQWSNLTYINEITPRPILFIVGDHAHSKAFSERAYKLANEPKELYEVKDAEHIDLYDNSDKIPFDKVEDFFKSNLK